MERRQGKVTDCRVVDVWRPPARFLVAPLQVTGMVTSELGAFDGVATALLAGRRGAASGAWSHAGRSLEESQTMRTIVFGKSGIRAAAHASTDHE